MDTDTNRIRIAIADDHAIFRDGLRKLLEAEDEFELVGEASDGRAALDLVRRVTADVLLLDLNMPNLGGLETLAEVVRLRPAMRPIILAASVDRSEILQALRLGARGIVLKSAATQLLYKCIRAVVAGEIWVGRESVPELVDALKGFESISKSPAASIAGLTDRERQIVAAIVSGASNRDVARTLSVTEQTVKNHLSRIFEKCGVSNRTELAVLAAAEGRTRPS